MSESIDLPATEPEAKSQESPPVTRESVLDALDLTEGALKKGSLTTGVFNTDKGVVLRANRPNPKLIQKAVERFTPPEVPTYYDEDFQADKPNPSDPDYLDALEAYNGNVLLLITDVYMSSVDVINVPDGISALDDAAWVDDLDIFGINVPKVGRSRLLAWLNYYVMNEDEYKEFIEFVFLYNNRIKEEDVRSRLDSFRNNATGDADTGVPVTEESEPRDNVPVRPGTSVDNGVRSKRSSTVRSRRIHEV